MGAEDEILGLIDAIYEAAFDSASWEAALTKLADTMGMAQIGLLKLDRRVHTYELDRAAYRSSHGRHIQEILGFQ